MGTSIWTSLPVWSSVSSTCCLKYVSCKCKVLLRGVGFPCTCAFRIISHNLEERIGVAPGWFHISLRLNLYHGVACLWTWRYSHVCNICSISVANNFVHLQSSADYGYYASSEVTYFVYCLLQKIEQSSDLPLVEQWEEYMTLNHSKFAPIEKDRFLAATRVLSALEKVESSYLKKEFRRDCRKFLEDFLKLCAVNCCCKVRNRPGVKLFLPSFSDLWGRSCSYAAVWHAAWWTARERRGERRRDGGLQVGISVVRAKAEATGADFI